MCVIKVLIMSLSYDMIKYCSACHSRTSNIEKHLIEMHAVAPRGTRDATRWYVAAITNLTNWVKTIDDLLHYLPLDESDTKIICEKATKFYLEAATKSIKVPGEWIYWGYYNGVAKIVYIGANWIKFFCYDEPVGKISRCGDMYHWNVVDISGTAYTKRTARLNMLAALKRKYGSYYHQYASIRIALFEILPQPIAEAIDAIVFQTFNSDKPTNYASRAYIHARIKEINPAKKLRGNTISIGDTPTEWERIAWS